MQAKHTRGCLATVLAIAVVSAWAHAANAAPRTPPSKLAYERTPVAAGCADEPAMREAIAGRLGYDPFTGTTDASSRRVAIALDRRDDEWQARITLEDPATGGKASRSLSSNDPACDELVSTVSLAVALAIDPLAIGKAPGADRAETKPPPPPAEPKPVDRPPAEPKPPDDARPKAAIFAAAGGFFAAGMVPGVSLGPRLRAGVVWPKVSLALEGLYVAPATETSGAGKVQASILAGGFVPCLRVPADSLVVDTCARALFGGLFGETNSAAISTPSTDPWIAIGLELGLELPITTALRLRMHGGALATLTRTFLRIRDQGQDVDVFRTSVLSGGGGIDLVVLFP